MIRRLFKELFYNGAGTLSLSRVALAVAIIQVDAIVWLCVLWVRHLTVTGQMESGALLASAVFTGIAAILGAQVTGAVVAQVFQMKFGSGSISDYQLNRADTRAVEEPEQVPDAPIPAELTEGGH